MFFKLLWARTLPKAKGPGSYVRTLQALTFKEHERKKVTELKGALKWLRCPHHGAPKKLLIEKIMNFVKPEPVGDKTSAPTVSRKRALRVALIGSEFPGEDVEGGAP